MVMFRLQDQLNMLEKELESRQGAINMVEDKYRELLSKLEAAPKKELMDNYIADVERLTKELREANDMLNE